MIDEQEQKLHNIMDEMSELRKTHASAFKERPENHAGSIRDFTGTSKGLSPGKF